jgi:exopolysaccharide production protein ExoQ
MPPPLALFLTLGFIFWLFRRDFRERPNVSGALWIPLIWMLIICSRPVSVWLQMFGLPLGGTSVEEGSPLDALVWGGLIVSGFYVLNKRQVSLSEVVRNNGWLTVFFIYCFLAIFWSDFPFVSFKRWIKIVGHPIMVLILFTEPHPRKALITLIMRCAYIILPVSILFIKYYPQWGRGFDPWSGEGFNTGITTTKNTLGCVCLVLGLFLFWYLINLWRTRRSAVSRFELWLTAGLLFLVGYNLRKAHSSTSLISLLLGMVIIAALGFHFVNKRQIGTYAVMGLVLVLMAQLIFDVYGSVVEWTGRGSTIEGRAELWRELLQMKTNPVFGTGFESFWLGERQQQLWEEHWWRPTEAHNGYLEIYLSLGLVGLMLVAGLFLSIFLKCRLELLRDFEWGRFRMGVLLAITVYNWTEAAFKGLSPLWFVFYIIAMDYRYGVSRPLPIYDQEPVPERELMPARL